ncbi:response regulator transcription factor [Lichenihabitans sp. Uapishka_5]|uniref:response regulator transcription factor n=1 Tax=Lichenihabitans sp. Uapishka_5 TaxID=3037302 RepID=UPI0029E7D617|nr:response regulator transcription factor [Lichenihabitans sp. Uapishka_5]MDX7951743.1 response regulator transcription factor [Lichenihabitans sp. Uapishka_5]
MAGTNTVLVVDDERQIQRFLRPALTAAGFTVEATLSGEEALRCFLASPPEVVVLDLGLPDMNGLAVLAEIRKTSPVPVVILSARDDEAGKVAALEAGADDYVSKPFGVGELVARLRTALRHAVQVAGTTAVYTAGDLVIDTLAHRVTVRGEPVKLTPKEYDILHLLTRHAGRVLTHQQILNEVWGPHHGEQLQYLRVFMGRLRQKVEADPADPRLLLNEPGVGYRLAAAHKARLKEGR